MHYQHDSIEACYIHSAVTLRKQRKNITRCGFYVSTSSISTAVQAALVGLIYCLLLYNLSAEGGSLVASLAGKPSTTLVALPGSAGRCQWRCIYPKFLSCLPKGYMITKRLTKAKAKCMV
jgi:hypothetical protein